MAALAMPGSCRHASARHCFLPRLPVPSRVTSASVSVYFLPTRAAFSHAFVEVVMSEGAPGIVHSFCWVLYTFVFL